MKNDYTYNRAPGSLAAYITPFCKHLNCLGFKLYGQKELRINSKVFLKNQLALAFLKYLALRDAW